MHRAAWEMDQGRKPTYFASLAKVHPRETGTRSDWQGFCADHAMKTCVDAVQIFGGNGLAPNTCLIPYLSVSGLISYHSPACRELPA